VASNLPSHMNSRVVAHSRSVRALGLSSPIARSVLAEASFPVCELPGLPGRRMNLTGTRRERRLPALIAAMQQNIAAMR
jgi:hypothetical protein